MGNESFSISEVIPARPEQIYSAWLSTAAHSAFTGEEAAVEPFVGGKHSTFGGYAVGRTVELQPGRRIVQTWRSQDFPEEAPDSRLEVTLEETLGGTLLTILHTDVPEGHSERYRDGWTKYYLEALKEFFSAGDDDGETASMVDLASMPLSELEVVQGERAARNGQSSHLRVSSAKRTAETTPRASRVQPKRAKPKAKAKAKTAKATKAKPRRQQARTTATKAKRAKAKPRPGAKRAARSKPKAKRAGGPSRKQRPSARKPTRKR